MLLPSIKWLPSVLTLIGLITVFSSACSPEPGPTAVPPTSTSPATEAPSPTPAQNTPNPLPEVTQWGVFDAAIQLPGEYTHEQKYLEIGVTARFVGPDGREVAVNGFWDGGRTWRVRFAPSLPGEWTYTIRAVDDQGEIAASNGRFQAIPPTAELLENNPNYRGFLQLSDNGRYLTYADGTPFFWMGDTAWRANQLTMSFVPQPDDEGPDVAEFPTYLDNRQGKGFSVIQVVAGFPTQPERINEGGPTYLEMFSVINPENFQWLDRRLEAILERGMVPVIIGQWELAVGTMTPEDLQRYWQYLIARTQAYNVIWIVTGEYGFEDDLDDVRALGEFIQTQNSTNHLVTVHPTPNRPHPAFSSAEHFWGEAWLDFHLHQTWDTAAVRETMVGDYGRLPPTPAVNAESGYDGMRSWDRERVRLEAWATFMSGGAGYTYGANGVWNWNDGCCDDEQHEPPRWHEAIDIPSSYDMQRLVDFFAPLPWWELTPNEELTSDGYVLATPGERYLVYLPDLPLEAAATRWWWTGKQVEETAVTLDLGDITGTFTVSWFNPATGDTVAGEAITGGQRHDLIAPFSGDALLHLTSE
ncbi:MAG: DUF4038 domain-containing protein [Anaerolineae bacterium]|nr:DUF4038 domain-containing protein [Anaerolineae bacterium]